MTASLAVMLALGACELIARFAYEAPPDPMREPPLLFERHPEIGLLQVPNQAGYLDDGLATINALGLRGELPETPKPANQFRVLAIGDSTTFGWGVDDTDTYGWQLERMFGERRPAANVRVVNAGVSAHNLEDSARLLRYFAPRLEPDLVLVGFFWNDLPHAAVSPDGVPLTSATALESVEEPPQFRLGNQPSGLNRILRRSRALYMLRHAWRTTLARSPRASNQVQWEMALLEGRRSAVIEQAWREVETILSGIRDLGAASGFEVGVLIMPIRAQVEQSYPDAAYQTRAAAIVSELGLFLIDPLERFITHPDPQELFIPYDRMHFSREGNALVAEAALEALGEIVSAFR